MKGIAVQSNFQRLNLITGWIVGLIACTVYILTMEPTGSFWDCGEFVASCDKLQIPHPPGAPLFILMGRFFIILFGDNPHTAARAVNCMSALASGLSILFLFWTITHFARKLVQTDTTKEPDSQQTFTILAAGAIGALAYTFCDSFWYSAVEGEVYASSAFFTAIVFWAILKWEQNQTDNKRGADRWLIFIFYMMGLSIGVHLLNLLTIPAIVMVYYFKRYRPTRLGTLAAFLIGCAITGFVQVVVIQYTIKWAGNFDVFFVNSLNLPFFSGFATFFVLLAAAFIMGIRWAVRRNKYYLKIGLWGAAFMLLGYSTYFTTMIRSNADTPVDMYNVDNPVSLVGYLSRETYGDWPILYGPDFTDPPPTVEAGDQYAKGENRYEVTGKKYAQDWAHSPSSHLFPRMYSSDNTRGEIDTYKKFSGMVDGDNPTMADNIKYFLNYQTNWMYLRYFLWNFAGKQNDLQGFGNPRDSNWVSGISFVDNLLYGDQSKLPDTAHKNNKAYNRLYMLPLLLGLLGLLVQYRRNRRDALVTGMLFFFTGWAIVMYLNQAGLQPRERDYAFAGSFYVFAIWIGLGVIAVQQLIQRLTPRIPRSAASWSAAALCLLAVPILMASQEWDDHDRSKKTLARDLAADYLESCPPNAILFSFEDNDTYPIWYAQEVEGIRPDVRVIINTLSGTDWLINSLRYKVNNAAPVDPLFTPDEIMGDKKAVVYFTDAVPGFDKNAYGYNKDAYYDLYDTFTTVLAKDDPRFMAESSGGTAINLLPARKFSLPVDARQVLANGIAHPGEQVVPQLHLDISPQKRMLMKNELTMLAIIAANKWQRPICFTNTSEINALGLGKYARNRGLTYELTPIEDSHVDNDVAYKNIMTKFQYGHAGTPGVYFDEDNRRYLNFIKFSHAEIASSLAAAGRKEDARRVLENYDHNVDITNFPYGLTSSRGSFDNSYSLYFLQACYAAGDDALAAKVSASMKKDLQQQMQYYQSRGERMTDEQLAISAQQALEGKPNNLSDKQGEFAQDILSAYTLLLQMTQLENQYKASLIKPSM
ncbi:glycosyltransferase family 117 protein [Puia dinghuensis]|uniref:Membrane protein n=1 Tax=Puia dinghuensis TaxID=1792502 RepID=A0A8J2UH88_9BACT|nr:DUF2723 domain-containing protein [Puia dinghuensis]GGB17527.1 membrane protein [Puia dinghuensis]